MMQGTNVLFGQIAVVFGIVIAGVISQRGVCLPAEVCAAWVSGTARPRRKRHAARPWRRLSTLSMLSAV